MDISKRQNTNVDLGLIVSLLVSLNLTELTEMWYLTLPRDQILNE